MAIVSWPLWYCDVTLPYVYSSKYKVRVTVHVGFSAYCIRPQVHYRSGKYSLVLYEYTRKKQLRWPSPSSVARVRTAEMLLAAKNLVGSGMLTVILKVPSSIAISQYFWQRHRWPWPRPLGGSLSSQDWHLIWPTHGLLLCRAPSPILQRKIYTIRYEMLF